MTRYRRALATALGVFLSLSLLASPAALASEHREEPVRAIVTFDPEAPAADLTAAIAALPDAEVLWTYAITFSGAAVEAVPNALAEIAALPGVERAVPAARRTLRPAGEEGADEAFTTNSLDLMDLSHEDLSYNGDGMVIAVIDGDFRLSHEVFADYGLAETPALSAEDVAAFAASGGTAGVYVSPRVPFAYDYADGDGDVSLAQSDSHGTHVAALALGWAQDEDGNVRFQGAAPAAQLLAMKVFPDAPGASTDDAVITRAIEDAAALGADVINLSLGTPAGFVEDTALTEIYHNIFASLHERGVAVCCSAGNNAVSTAYDEEGDLLPSGAYTDYGMAAAPGSYPGALSVAAADAAYYAALGCIAAGDRKIPFNDGAAAEGFTLPALLSLAGQTLPLVSVPGLGTPEDFAEVDAAGKVALVARGELTFTEKAANAAAAGAVACLVINNEPDAITPSLDGGTIPCAAVSREDGAYLRALAEAGDAAVTILDEVIAKPYAEEPTVSSFSSWGPVGELHLVPHMTAPGGGIFSASAGGDAQYVTLSGTSMASPSAAGAFAVVLEALRDRGLTGEEALSMAEGLLEGTARILTDEVGTPLSPRQQGAGLIQVSAALEAPVVLSKPLAELGDSERGRFTLRLTFQNLSGEDVTLTPDLTALTDAFAEAEGAYYSLLSPLDITEHVSVAGPQAVTIPGGGSASAAWTLSVDSALRQELAAVYPNGFYVDGFMTFTAPDGFSLHAAFLGYCGDWDAAPILSPTDHQDLLEEAAALSEAGEKVPAGEVSVDRDLGVNLAFISGSAYRGDTSLLLGENAWASLPYDAQRGALPAGDTDALYTAGGFLVTELYTLRSARRLVLLVSDAATGEIYAAREEKDVPKFISDYETYYKEAFPLEGFLWDGTDADGVSVPGGTVVELSVYAWSEWDQEMESAYRRAAGGEAVLTPEQYQWLLREPYADRLQWRLSLTVDSRSPAITTAWEGEDLTVTVQDDQFLAYAAVRDGAGHVLAEGAFADEEVGEAHTFTLPGADLPDTLYILAQDYASNTTGYAVPLAGEEEGHRCAAALLTDVDPDAWYHEAVDYAYSAGLMEGSAPLTFQPGDGATRTQVLRSLYILAGAPETAEADLPFTDAAALDGQDLAAVTWAWENGVISGYSDTLLGAHAVVQRQQLASLLFRAAALAGEVSGDGALLADYEDGDEASPWAAEALAWALEEGLLTARDGALAPRAYVTRAELAQVLLNLAE